MQFVIHSGLLYEYTYNVKYEASRGSIKLWYRFRVIYPNLYAE